jgi:hypothetical protein
MPVKFAKKNSQAWRILQFLSLFGVFLGCQELISSSVLYAFLFTSLPLPDDLLNFILFI